MLSALELADARADVTAELIATCEVRAVTDGVPQTWADPGVTVACIITNPAAGGGGDEVFYAGSEPTVIVHLPATAVIKSGDRIISAGTTYKTVTVDAVRNDTLLHRLTCVEVRTPGEPV